MVHCSNHSVLELKCLNVLFQQNCTLVEFIARRNTYMQHAVILQYNLCCLAFLFSRFVL